MNGVAPPHRPRALPLWQPSRFAALPRGTELALTAALLGFAFCGAAFPDLGEKLANLLLLAAIALFVRGSPALRRSPAFWLLLAAIALPLASWALSQLTHPDWAERSPKVNRVSNWLLPIAVAYALGGHARNALLALAAALAGLLVAVANGGGLAAIGSGLAGIRIDFGLHNAQHAALYFGVALLGLAALLPRLLQFVQTKPSRRWPAGLLWLALVALAAIGLAIAQTRAAWLGVLIAGALLLWLARRQFRQQRYWLLAALCFASLSTLMLLQRTELFEQRFAPELETITATLSGDDTQITLDSAGIRLRTWGDALDWVAQRPLLGWGGNGRALVLAQTAGYPDWLRASTRHLHSSYLDTLVNYGIIGLALLLALWGWLLAAAWRASASGSMPRDLLHFYTAFMVYWAIVNGFESYIYYSSGTFVFALIGGAALTHIWRHQLDSNAASQGKP